jgi:hypothetical protein
MDSTDTHGEPFFHPFEGQDYQSHLGWPGRLMVVGESQYLTPEDVRPDFTQILLAGVCRTGLGPGWRTKYFRKLFYVLTGKRARDIAQPEWQSVWNSIAFYEFVQSSRLTRARMRPNKNEWEDSKAAFLTTVSRLRPEYVLITGKQVNAWISGSAVAFEGGLKLPIGETEYAFARHICHPSSSRFRSKEARTEFERLLSMELSARSA